MVAYDYKSKDRRPQSNSSVHEAMPYLNDMDAAMETAPKDGERG